nr:reverse transcriptase domain-containing protein [Tanacetum cinerariifolium]
GSNGGNSGARETAFILSEGEAAQDPNVVTAHIKKKKTREKPKEKRLKDVTIVQDFPEVFPKDLLGLPPIRQVEFQIKLVHGAAPVADDILVYSIRKEEHEEHLTLILDLLKKEELYGKFLKCEFWIPKVQFLGHMIDSQGIHVDPAKIESIKDSAAPKTVT